MNPSTSFASSLRAHFCSTLASALAFPFLMGLIGLMGPLGTGNAQAQVTVFDTSGNVTFSYLTISGSNAVAQQFMSASLENQVLGSVTLSLGGVVGTPWAQVNLLAQSGSAVAVNYDDIPVSTDNWPGESVGLLYSGMISAGDLTLTLNSIHPLLTANTKYWISLSVIGAGSVAWNWADTYVTGSDESYLANASWNPGAPYNQASNRGFYSGPQKMSVVIEEIPEPGSIGLGLLGLGALALARRCFRAR